MVFAPTLLFLDSLGTGEFLLIVFVVIIFFGGKKIPEMARVVGKGMREFKAAANNIQDEIQKSVTEIERNVNIEHALRDDAPSTQTKSAEAAIPAKEPVTPTLIRADLPDVHAQTPPFPEDPAVK
jgi:TatA/E family protein of Tat protein translocase